MANYLPATYQPGYGYNSIGTQMYPQYQQQNMQTQTQPVSPGLIWVDGEVGAKAYQMPPGIPAGQPIALWDTNDTVIYLKSMNPMGMPNPLQKAHYTLEEYKSVGKVTAVPDGGHNMDGYVRKEEMEQMKEELLTSIREMATPAKHAKEE